MEWAPGGLKVASNECGNRPCNGLGCNRRSAGSGADT